MTSIVRKHLAPAGSLWIIGQPRPPADASADADAAALMLDRNGFDTTQVVLGAPADRPVFAVRARLGDHR